MARLKGKKLGNTVAQRNERLVKPMSGVGEMKLGDYQSNTIDAFGDAYEFLMGMYASNAGKSGGTFFILVLTEMLTSFVAAAKFIAVKRTYLEKYEKHFSPRAKKVILRIFEDGEIGTKVWAHERGPCLAFVDSSWWGCLRTRISANLRNPRETAPDPLAKIRVIREDSRSEADLRKSNPRHLCRVSAVFSRGTAVTGTESGRRCP